MSSKSVEKRLEALEAIVNSNSVTLIDPDNTNLKAIISFKGGNIQWKKVTTVITEEPLTTINVK